MFQPSRQRQRLVAMRFTEDFKQPLMQNNNQIAVRFLARKPYQVIGRSLCACQECNSCLRQPARDTQSIFQCNSRGLTGIYDRHSPAGQQLKVAVRIQERRIAVKELSQAFRIAGVSGRQDRDLSSRARP
jgi:hypothetical protein